MGNLKCSHFQSLDKCTNRERVCIFWHSQSKETNSQCAIHFPIIINYYIFITAAEFDERFDAAEDLTAYYELEQANRPGLEQRRISVDFPAWMVHRLDMVARRLGVTRQSVIKVFISEKLKEEGR